MTTNGEKMHLLTTERLNQLLPTHQKPCLSLYQPTHRRHPENQQDPTRFRNLLKQLEASLQTTYPAIEPRLPLEPFEALANDAAFWNHTLDGLAVLGAPGIFRIFRLPRPVAERAVVADRFHLKPLWRLLQWAERYQVLSLGLQSVRLFEGDRDGLEEVDLAPEVQRTMTEALGAERTEPHDTVASYGGVGAASMAMHHGHGGKSDGADVDATRFFRAIDRAILEHHSGPSSLPLILAALPEHHHRFHEVSRNPFLLAEGVTGNPDAMTDEVLRAAAWKVVQPRYETRLAELEDEFSLARSKGLGSDDLPNVAKAAVAGRVGTLLVEANRQIPGHLDGTTGRVNIDASHDPGVDDLLDDLSELVGRMGGKVLVIPHTRMPGQSGLAAIYRY